MRFRRNLKEEKLFRQMAQISIILTIIFAVIYFITWNVDILGLFLASILLPLFFYFITYNCKNSCVEFQKEKIVFINHIAPSVEIHISELKVIMIPSPQALENKRKDNNIIFKLAPEPKITSHTPEIEKYIVENVNVQVVYYDNYNDAIRSAYNTK